MTIAVIGDTSFLAKSLPRADNMMFLSHHDAITNREWIDRVTCAVNFAYDPEGDLDSLLARMVADTPMHYVMISSRQVYGQGPDRFALSEDRASTPTSDYGQNKVFIEQSLQSLIDPARLTILRVSNVFGHETGRSTFFGRMLTTLKRDNEIVFNMAPETRRDFIAVPRFARIMAEILNAPQPGIFNVGSGFGTSCGDIAVRVIEGYGAGQLRVTNTNMNDQFWLDTTRLKKTYPAIKTITPDMLNADCIECGRWLKT